VHRHLILEYRRIDLLLRKQLAFCQLAGQDPRDPFRGLTLSFDDVVKEGSLSFGQYPANRGDLPEDFLSTQTHSEKQILVELTGLREAAAEAGVQLPLDRVRAVFSLCRFEVDALLICLAPALDRRYERVFGFLQDDVTRKAASADLIFRLFEFDEEKRLQYLRFFQPDQVLRRHQLVVDVPEPAAGLPLLSRPLTVPNTLQSFLLGEYVPDEALEGAVDLKTLPWLRKQVSADKLPLVNFNAVVRQNPILAFFGADEVRQEQAAWQAARQLNKSLMVIDLETLAAEASFEALLNSLLRDCALLDAVPCLAHFDSITANKDNRQFKAVERLLDQHHALCVISSKESWQREWVDNAWRRKCFWYEFGVPGSSQRLAIWKEHINGSVAMSEREMRFLASQFQLSTSQIKSAVQTAETGALQNGQELSTHDIFLAARQFTHSDLDRLAVKVESRYEWDDVVLPEEELAMLHELVDTISQRGKVLEEWGLGKKLVSSSGVSALFAGPPGTGKTLCAQIIANALKLELYKIDLSTIVSKYIGETEKNLERIFTQAQNSGAVLFFDEADAIFGKRSEVKDAHDRYANIEVGYLLQKMESYDGVVILATNLRSNMDEAFIRRLQFVVDFPFPEEEQRIEIWKVLFPPTLPRSADLRFEALGKRFRLSGGNIRNVIVSAAFLAASENMPVSNHHLIHAIRRELRKMGRLVNEVDLVLEVK
jgi:SpoVK/Ycf46/Vps4 family AAA+-type ATPase